MADNPVCKDENYQSTIIAYLKHMSYLDYELITAQRVKIAREDRHEEMQELEAKEKLLEQEDAKEAAFNMKKEAADAANLSGVDALYTDMMKDDTELSKLKLLPGFSDILDSYKEQFQEATQAFSKTIFEKFESKKKEQFLCGQALQQIKKDSEHVSRLAIDKYSHLKKINYAKYDKEKGLGARVKGAHKSALEVVDSLNAPLQELSDTLMELELQQSDATSRIFDDLYEALKSLQVECILQINNYTQRIFEFEKIYLESVLKLSQQLQERHAAGQLMGTLEDATRIPELKIFLEDKEMLSQSIQTSHEKHEELINSVESGISERERLFTDKYVQELRDAEYLRNRQRIAEIFNLIERNKADNMEKLGLQPIKVATVIQVEEEED